MLKNSIDIVREKYSKINFCLNEKSRRIWAATEASSLGWGGTSIVSKATGISRTTITKALKEISQFSSQNENNPTVKCIRATGGGRKKLTDKYPNLLTDLELLVDPVTRGDPESPLLWSSKSSYKLADELKQKGYEITQRTVCDLLDNLGYTLQANKKVKEGSHSPDRNKQFKYISNKVKLFQKQEQPVISVDTKKKEKIGNFKNPGREYHLKKKSPEVNVYDFIDQKNGKVSPYGVYDISKNKGWVSVGNCCDTAEFAVNSIRMWWFDMGKVLYPKTRKIYMTADCGGSNGYRVRLWKTELQKLANEINLEIHVSHFPPGTSKWNKIEHRMFSFISKNWRGKPLIDKATVVNLIANTKTQKGLEIKAKLDENLYQRGIKVSDEELEKIKIIRYKFHGEWNYKIKQEKN